jgi:hypothetical protein
MVNNLAADLLDTRTEIAALRAFVGNNMLRSDYQTVDHMRTEIAALRAKLKALRLVDTLARNSTDMTKIREAERAAYACGAIEEER